MILRLNFSASKYASCLVFCVFLCACGLHNQPSNEAKPASSEEDTPLDPLGASSGFQGVTNEALSAVFYDVSDRQELWGKFDRNKELQLTIPLFLLRDEFAVFSPVLIPPEPYNADHRGYGAPTNTDRYDSRDWPNIVGVVDANTRLKPTRIVLFGIANVPDSFDLIVEAEILDGRWAGTRVDIGASELALSEEIGDVSFNLKGVGRLRPSLLFVYGPDERFLRAAE